MKYINKANVVIKSWCDNPENGAIEQALNLANHPFVFHHVALMPDTHQGFGMPIGGVACFKDVVIPNAVGVDIGCGMAAVKTSLKSSDLTTDRAKEIMSLIRKKIPIGFNKHSKAQKGLPELVLGSFGGEVVFRELNNAAKQLGTLGGGNHFIEIQKGDDDHIWFMVHSGSRNLGLQVAKHYNKIAVELNEKLKSSVPKSHELAFLPLDLKEGKAYLAEMNYCLDFAQANRDLMVERIKEAFCEFPCELCSGNGGKRGKKCINCNGTGLDSTKMVSEFYLQKLCFEETINIHHNYATMENHFGQNVMIHRKGATSAKEGELGIIPGSQGTSSYIVKGKGNKDSFMSCSHGAGRTMSRSKAKKELDLKTEQKMLEDKGIIHSIRSEQQLDEASSAYKDISIVMEEQKDLVDIVVKLEPIGVIKG